jgi:hypothetical protein
MNIILLRLSSHWRTQLQSFKHYAEQQDSETK